VVYDIMLPAVLAVFYCFRWYYIFFGLAGLKWIVSMSSRLLSHVVDSSTWAYSLHTTTLTQLKYKYVKSLFILHADPTSRDILQRSAWPARWLIRPIFGFLESKVHKNGRFPALDVDEPPCKIWRY